MTINYNSSKYKKRIFSSLPLLAAFVVAGCALASLNQGRDETANRLASAAWMVEREVPAGKFLLRGYERMHERHATANVYIEGDGFTNGFSGNVGNPTPSNPVALHLATKDKARNVVYLARPCQYIGLNEKETACTPEFWNDKRYSAEIIEAYSAALNEISKRYNINGYNLIGYDGGAAIALLLASKRADVHSVRTIAGVLDHEAVANISGKTPLTGSLNPVSQASALSHMPQYHFIGGQDEIIPPSILQSYMQAMPPSPCIHSMLVQEAGHSNGWVDKWPELLELPITCFGSAQGFDAYNIEGRSNNIDARLPSLQHRTIPETPEKP